MVGIFAFTLVLTALPNQDVGALGLTNRSLMVSSTAASNDVTSPTGATYVFGSGAGQIPAGDSRNGTKVSHTYSFTVPSATTPLHGFTIEYCQTAFAYTNSGACTATDLLAGSGFSGSAWNAATVNVSSTTNATGLAFNVTSRTANYLELTNATGIVVAAGDVVTITFPASETNYFRNPNSSYRTLAGVNGTYFAHVKTFASTANTTAAFTTATPSSVDDGTVTNNITQSININTRVQETLNFSVEGEAKTPDGPTPIGTACDPLIASPNIVMGDANNALEATVIHKASSFFRLATNSANGTIVYFSGDTLRSGSNQIAPIANTGAAAAAGGEQFGLGINLTAADTNLTNLVPVGAYGGADTDSFAFDPTSTTAPRAFVQSTGVVQCETGQVDYVANISPDTPAGIYTTKINYIASPRY